MKKQKALLRELFDVAVAAASPANCLRTWLPERPAGRILVVGAGKAAASMSHELEQAWQGPLTGLVIVPYGYASDCQSIEVIEAAHPIPDAAGVAAAARILDSVSGLSADDTVVCVISGGGSSLLCLPIDGVTLAEKRDITSQLLLSGAAINEINCVRKKLSAIKGGKLAAACAPARVLTLIISDVPGNDIAMVASGPTVSDASPASEALDILDRYAVTISDTVRQSVRSSRPVTITAGDVRILASSDDAIIASAALAEKRKITPYVLGDLSGDARTLAREHAELAMQIAAGHGPLSPPCVVLSGGETTVNVRGNGRGGRNGEYALALAIALNGHPAIHAIACDTDGIDGNGDNAGSFVTPDILDRAANAGIDAKQMLERNDSYGFFSATLDLIITGPTGTNVNDFRALLISDS
ncbi:MAG: glycerate kinase [Gammaproteobacteria bacterium]|nr:glycerate kinase [Gammaproteobacteria bacterium]